MLRITLLAYMDTSRRMIVVWSSCGKAFEEVNTVLDNRRMKIFVFTRNGKVTRKQDFEDE